MLVNLSASVDDITTGGPQNLIDRNVKVAEDVGDELIGNDNNNNFYIS